MFCRTEDNALRSINLVATDYESFGTLSGLLTVMAQVLRAVGVFKRSYIDISANLTQEELAEGLWFGCA